jgi:hypothetical protein
MLLLHQAKSIPVSKFIEQFHRGEIKQSGLFIAHNEAGRTPDTILFSVADGSCRAEDAHGVNRDAVMRNCVPIVGFTRQDTINEFEIMGGSSQAVVTSERYHHSLVITEIADAPILMEMAEQIQNDPTVCLPEQRDILHDANEILCFILGYKHVLVRQRLNSATTHGATLNGVPFGLFTPYVRVLLNFLFESPSVWRGVSINHYQFWEEAYVFAHPGYEPFAERLVELKVQDASIPGQPNEESTLGYILAVGMLLGYPTDAVHEYAEHMMPNFDLASSAAQERLANFIKGMTPADRNQWFQVAHSPALDPVPGYEKLLQMSHDDMPQTMHEVVAMSSWMWPDAANKRTSAAAGGHKEL